MTFTTKKAASRWLARFESGAIEIDALAIQQSDVRLVDYASEWIRTRQLRPRTRELYELQLRLHIEPTLGTARLAKLQPAHVRQWHAQLLAGHLSAVSVAKVYRLLRAILNTAVDDGYLSRNPCRIEGAGTERSPERPIPTVDDVARLADALPDHLSVIVWVAALAGLRKGELLGLARRHIDLARCTIRVERALQEIRGEGAVLTEPKTASSIRTVAIPDRLVALLEVHLSAHVAGHPEALLFTNSHGRPVRASVWRAAWGQATTGAGLEGVRLHDLRHLAGTLTAQAGATLRETMDRLGHSTTGAAMRYQHVAHERAAEVARRLDDLL